MEEKKIYRLNDDISFRKCSLFVDDKLSFGDCTNFSTAERNWRTYYSCNQDGIHFHCTTHPEIELEVENKPYIAFIADFFNCNLQGNFTFTFKGSLSSSLNHNLSM